MGIGSSSICVLAVVTSSVSLTLTHEEADYYMMCGRIVVPPAERMPTYTSPFDPFVKGMKRGIGWVSGPEFATGC